MQPRRNHSRAMTKRLTRAGELDALTLCESLRYAADANGERETCCELSHTESRGAAKRENYLPRLAGHGFGRARGRLGVA